MYMISHSMFTNFYDKYSFIMSYNTYSNLSLKLFYYSVKLVVWQKISLNYKVYTVIITEVYNNYKFYKTTK